MRVHEPAGGRSGALRLPSDGTNTDSDCVIRVNTDSDQYLYGFGPRPGAIPPPLYVN